MYAHWPVRFRAVGFRASFHNSSGTQHRVHSFIQAHLSKCSRRSATVGCLAAQAAAAVMQQIMRMRLNLK